MGIFNRLRTEDSSEEVTENDDRSQFLSAVAENEESLREGEKDTDAIASAADVSDEVVATRNLLARRTAVEEGISTDTAESIEIHTESWNKRLGEKIFGAIRQESFRSKQSAKTQTLVTENAFLNKLKSIWDAIVAMLKKAANWFRDMISKFFGSSATGGCANAAEDLKKSVALWDDVTDAEYRVKDDVAALPFNRVASALTSAINGAIVPPAASTFPKRAEVIAEFYNTDLNTLMTKVSATYTSVAGEAKALKTAVEKIGNVKKDNQVEGEFGKVFEPAAARMTKTLTDFNGELSTIAGKPLGNSAYFKLEEVSKTSDSNSELRVKVLSLITATEGGDKTNDNKLELNFGDVSKVITAANLFVKAATDISKNKSEGDKATKAISDCADAADAIAKAFEKAGNAKLTEEESKKVSAMGHVIRSVEPIMKTTFLKTTSQLIKICNEFSTDLKENRNRVEMKKED